MSGIGSMRHYGTIKRGNRIPEPGGGGTTEYEDVWAGFGQLSADNSAREDQDSQAIIQNRKRWFMRWQPDFLPATGWRLEHEGIEYAITGIREQQERERYWIINLVQNDGR